MTIISKSIRINTVGNYDMVDITAQIAQEVTGSGLSSGMVNVFISGSTAGITTIEYEDGLVKDFKNMWERSIPRNITYHHDRRWGDGREK